MEMVLNESCYYKTNVANIPSETAKKLFYYVQWTGHFVCKKDFLIKRKNFNSYLLLYTVSGKGILQYEGNEYEMKENSIMFIDCEKLHVYFPDSDRWEFKFIHFMGESSKKYYEYIYSLNQAYIINNAGELEKYFDNVYNFVKYSKNEEFCSDMIYRILIKLINLTTKNTKNTDSFKINDILFYISENYQDKITVQKLADISHLSRCYFSTIFKEGTGYSPYEYILNYRIQAAKYLLQNTYDSIEKIASECGFSDTSSFIRAFKRQEGISPLRYRKKALTE